MARITLFWCFEKKYFWTEWWNSKWNSAGHHSGLRLWRAGMLFSTKSKCHRSNFRISWMYKYSFNNLKLHFWWPPRSSKWCKSIRKTLYRLLLVHIHCFLLFRILSCSNSFFFIGVLQRPKNKKIQFIRYNLLSMNEFYDYRYSKNLENDSALLHQ